MMTKLLSTALTSLATSLATVFAILSLSACATTSTDTASTGTAQAASSTQSVDAANQPVANTKTASADGELICKRQAVIGSKFNRKVCATEEQWEKSAADNRRKTGLLQRNGQSRGTSN